jgi:hypothetical protein
VFSYGQKVHRITGKSVLIFILICISHCCFGQVHFCDSIPWSDKRPLRWSDFRGAPDSSSRVGALSHITFKYRLEREKDKIQLSTIAFFQPCTSWADTSAADRLSLSHEQTHFDIDELVRRSFVRDVSNSGSYNEKQLIRNYEHEYFLSMLSRQLMHKLYDLETDYHRNALQQVRWNEKVLIMLASLRQYAPISFEWNFPY